MNHRKIAARMITKMAAQSLRSSRLHNIFVMITIILASALLSALLMFANGQKQVEKKQLSHRQHASYHELTRKQTEMLKKDPRISFQIQVKTGILTSMDGYDVVPYYISELSDEIQLLELETGTLPASDREVALHGTLLRQMGIEPAPGSRVTFPFYDGSTETFTVSGILKGGDENTKQFPVLCSAGYARTGSQLKDIPYEVYIKLQDADGLSASECKNIIYAIGADAGISRKYAVPSKTFLDSLSLNGQSVMIYGLLGTVILSACFLVVYGVFYLSVTGRIHQYGQLRTIGMTRKQMKKFVAREGGILFLRSVPSGLITGCAAGYLMVPDGFQITHMLQTAALVFMVLYVITMISVHKPAQIAAAVSPVEALRYLPQDTMAQTENKKFCRSLTPAGLGIINFSKNRKKTAVTMLSLSLGGILYISAASYISSFDRTGYARQGYFKNAEFHITYSQSAISLNENGINGLQADHPLDQDLIRQIYAIDGVEKVAEIKDCGIRYDISKHDEYGSENCIHPLGETEMKKTDQYLEEGTNSYEQLMSGDYMLAYANSLAEEIYGWKFAPGDVITVHYYDDGRVCEKDITILGILNDKYMLDYPYQEGWFLMPEQVLQEMVPHNNMIIRLLVTVDPDKEEAVGEELAQLISENSVLYMETLADEKISTARTASRIFAAITSLALFIMMFSILSMINTLITNIVTRKQELAMLASIGMGKKQIHQMLLGESLVLVAVTLGITMTIGTMCGYALSCLLYDAGAFYMSFRFPVFSALGYTGILAAIPPVIIFACVYSFSRETLTERLRITENG